VQKTYSIMPSGLVTQEAYAANLEYRGRGLAVYKPFKIYEHSQKVGDIAFFNSHGHYMWVQNAFYSEVIVQGLSMLIVWLGLA